MRLSDRVERGSDRKVSTGAPESLPGQACCPDTLAGHRRSSGLGRMSLCSMTPRLAQTPQKVGLPSSSPPDSGEARAWRGKR
jgi:hypothetical protein